MGTLVGFAASWSLFADAVLAGTAAGALLGALGVFVLLGRMVFVSAALAQVASLGAALGLLLRARLGTGPPAATLTALGASLRDVAAPLGAWVATAGAAALLALQTRLAPRRLEALLGLLFVAGAAGTLLVANGAAAEMHDVQGLLFGDAVAVLPQARRALSWLTLGLWVPTAVALPALAEAWTDPQGARVRDVPVRALHAWVLFALSAAIAACTQVLGALPVFALSVGPALLAVAACRTLAGSFVAATGLGAAAGFGGYVLAYALDWPVGATQATVAIGAAAFGWLFPHGGNRAREPG